jgi:hypothetical protein
MRSHTRLSGSRYSAAMVGDVNSAVRRRTWKCIIKSSEATEETIPIRI